MQPAAVCIRDAAARRQDAAHVAQYIRRDIQRCVPCRIIKSCLDRATLLDYPRTAAWRRHRARVPSNLEAHVESVDSTCGA